MSVELKKKRIITEFPYKVRTEEHIWIPLNDGTRLAARMWFPESDTPLPVILEYIPYRKGDGTRMRDEPMHGYFSGHGYVVARVDMRGSGESDGLMMDEYLKQEQDDAVEVIDWLSRQPWSDGNVGMMGKSWGGFNCLQVAARRPPALKAIIPVAFTDDRYHDDTHYKGGCLLCDNFLWGALMLMYQSQPPDPKHLGEQWRAAWLQRLEKMPLWAANWMEHQVRDEYWEHGSVCEDYSAIQVPVLAFGGWADAYQNPVFTLLEGLSVPRRGIVGPWAHVYAHDGQPGPAMNFLREGVRWWDRWLKGIDTGNDAMSAPMIQAWIEDSIPPSTDKPASEGRWVSLESWPSADIQPARYALSYGKLTDSNPKGEELVLLKTPLTHGLLAGEWMGSGVSGENPPDQRIDNGMSMVFDSEPLPQPLEILGYPLVEIELSSDKPNAMLFASLCDVAPDGSSSRVSYGVMNLTHLHGHDRVVPLVPGQKVNAAVKLDCCGYRFAAGHRLRLSLATSYWPLFWPMPEDAVLTLNLAKARLTLPRFAGKECAGPDMQPESAPATPVTFLTEGSVDRTMTYDILNDRWNYGVNSVGGVCGEGIYRFDEIDVTVEHNLKRELSLSNGDPLSARYEICQNMRMGREGWWIDLDIAITKTSDAKSFYTNGTMTAKENGATVFTREWNHSVQRKGL